MRSARDAIEKAQTDLLSEQDARLVKRELLKLHEASRQLGSKLHDTEQARLRRPPGPMLRR